MCWIYMIICIYTYLLSHLWKAVAHLISADLRRGKRIPWNACKCKMTRHSEESQHQELEANHISISLRHFVSSWTIVSLTVFLVTGSKLSIQTTKWKILQNLSIMKIYKSFSCKLLIKSIPTVSGIYCWWILGQKVNSLTVLSLYCDYWESGNESKNILFFI